MGFSTQEEYEEFMREAPEFEHMLFGSGLDLTKFWFSVTPSANNAPGSSSGGSTRRRQWRQSPMDIESLDKWDAYTEAKEAMFHDTDTHVAPWTVIKSNDKKRARLEASSTVVKEPNDNQGPRQQSSVTWEPDKLIIGPPSVLSEHNPDRVFPEL